MTILLNKCVAALTAARAHAGRVSGALICFSLFAVTAHSEILYVNGATGNDSNGGTSAAPKKTIQGAVAIAVAGDEIVVAAGTYGPISTGNKAITITGSGGAGATVISGGGTGRCATLVADSVEQNATVLSGFTLTDGCATNVSPAAHSGYGGGALGGTLRNCILTGNAARSGGGAYSCIMSNCTVSGNMAFCGGGVYDCNLRECTLTDNGASQNGGGAIYSTLTGCTLTGNAADYEGGGACQCHLNNCTLSGNAAMSGGGASCCFPMNNCLLTGNTATGGGGGTLRCSLINCTVTGNAAAYAGGALEGACLSSIVWGNNAAADANHKNSRLVSCCAVPAPTSDGNISANPRFTDSANGNYRLMESSLCINAGANGYVTTPLDLGGSQRIQYGQVDIGAYESGYEAPVQQQETNTPVPVPYTWLDPYLGWHGEYDHNALANMRGANGVYFWESYVAGLVPTNPASRFLITNFVVNAASKVTALDWGPRLPDRDYKIWGKTNLNAVGEAWHYPTNPGTRFFKVTVDMLP